MNPQFIAIGGSILTLICSTIIFAYKAGIAQGTLKGKDDMHEKMLQAHATALFAVNATITELVADVSDCKGQLRRINGSSHK